MQIRKSDRAMRSSVVLIVVVILSILSLATPAQPAGPGSGIGVRGGVAQDPSQLVLGGQLEVGPVLGPAYVVPSLDLQLANGRSYTAIQTDLRWYLLPLPDTGVYFYGAAGPGITLADGDVGFGTSLAFGAHIPGQLGRRYNLEARFGFGDLPELKVLLAHVWGL